MNLEEQWKNIAVDDEDLSALIKKGVPAKTSKDPLKKITQNLLTNSILGFIISIGYVFILAKFPVWQVLACIGIVLLFTLWATIRALMMYLDMTKPVAEHALLQQLERYYWGVTKWMRLQQLAGWLIYPSAAAGGFMIGGSLGAGMPIDIVMKKPGIIIFLVVITALLVPLCFRLANWMFKKSFGKYTDQLKEDIERLKANT